MKTAAFRRGAVAVAAVSATALVLAGCSSSDQNGGGSAGGDVTLTVNTFNDFGYGDELAQAYEAEHPGVKVVFTKAATSNDSRANYFQKLGKKGLADIEAIEVDWLPEVMKYSDMLAPVPTDLSSRWLDWKVKAATDADGNLIGYGTDIGPEAVCYRADLFEAAGLPTDRAEVAKLLEGDWAKYFEVGAEYSKKTGKAFFDSAGGTYQGMINQVENAYEENDGTIIATKNAEVKGLYDQVLAASKDQSAHLGQWSDDWNAGLANGAFATMLCPGWMLGRHLRQRQGREDLGHRRRLPRRRRQLGRFVPDRSRQRRSRQGSAGARRLADLARDPAEGLHRRRHLPEPDRGDGGPGAEGREERVLQRRPGR